MSHPLGPLHTHGPSLAVYEFAQELMHSALAQVNTGDAGAVMRASGEFDVAAHCAETLGRRTADLAYALRHGQPTGYMPGDLDIADRDDLTQRAMHWFTVAVVREGCANDARAAAAAADTIPTPRPAATAPVLHTV